MQIVTRRAQDSLIVRLSGELDLQLSEAFKSEVSQQLAQSGQLKHLVLDLRGVTFIDSSGVGAIIGRYKEIRNDRNGKVVAFGPRPQVRRVLEFSGLLRLLPVADNQQQALAVVREGSSAS